MLKKITSCHALAALALTLGGATSVFAQRSTPVQLVHPSGAASDQFGYAVAISGDTMVVGANQDDVGANADQGSAHVYRWTGNGWTFEATLTATGGTAFDLFGYSVAIDGDTIVVGARADDVGANVDQGSAYVFTRSGTSWTQQAQLNATGGAASDLFGQSVGISGNTVVVGAPFDDVGANANQGSAYVFTRSGSVWTQQAQLTTAGGAVGDQLGYAVAISGDTVLAGANQDDVSANVDQGSVFVFTRSGATWSQQAQLTATGGAAGDQFGNSVAIDGDTAVIGAFLDDVGANVDQGSAYVFTRSGATWSQQAQLNAGGGAAGDNVGCSVSLSGETAVVGAYNDDVSANANQGSAFVFTRSGSTWSQQAQLTASDGAASDFLGFSVAIDGDTVAAGAFGDDEGANSNQGSARVYSRIGSTWIGPDLQILAADGLANDKFGTSVSISGDTAIVGAFNDDVGANADQGSAYVFVRSGTTWTQQAQLTATGGAGGDLFGISAAISGDTAIVGAYGDDVGAISNQGSAYVFVRSGTTWTQQAQLTAADGAANDFFSYSVALSGDTAVVGAYQDDVGANANQGSAYVFTRSGTTWTQQAKLTALDGMPSDILGFSVAIAGDTAVVGAQRHGAGADVNRGSAYVFSRLGTTWTQQASLTASDGAAGDEFGNSVAISGDTVVVGAYSHDLGANLDQGSVYIFTRSGVTWAQQTILTASDGAIGDQLGFRVAISGDTVVASAPYDTVGSSTSQGSAYLFTRSGTNWFQQAKLTAADGAGLDIFGLSVGVSGGTTVVGSAFDNVGANTAQGSVWIFGPAPISDLPLAHNDTLDVSYPTLSAALLTAQSGQQITGTQAAWRSVTTLDTAGRSLVLWSDGDLRTPTTSTMTLSGSSSLNLDPGNTMEIDGQLRASGYADLTADSFLLGSRGILTARTNSSLTINAPVATLDGQTRLEQDASFTLAGSATANGPTTAFFNTSLTAATTFTNLDTFSITAGTISAPLFWNRAAANIFGSTAVFGSYTNEIGATTTIRSGTLFVFGSLTNNGTIVGTVCAGCASTPPNLDITGNLTLGPVANLTMPFANATVHVGGDFDCAINANTRYDMVQATLQLEGATQSLEVMSTDIGPDSLGLNPAIPGHYPVDTLHLGPAPSVIQLVDARDNDTLGQAACEAIYVNSLVIDAGVRLVNPSCRIYYNTLTNNGSVDAPANLVQIGVSCPCSADFDQSGGTPDVGDIDAFFLAWLAGDPAADADCSGGTPDVGDIDAFFIQWLAGGC